MTAMHPPDPILKARLYASTDRPTIPYDINGLSPEAIEFYKKIEATTPGYLLGKAYNPNRNEWVNLQDRSDRFVGVMMPTRGWKGISFAIPNSISWTHSLFLNDPKKELCAATAWYRKYHLNQRIFIVEPFATDGRNARFNPLFEIRKGTAYEEVDAANIATAIVDPDGSGFEGDSGTWKKRARTLLTGLILHVLHSDEIREKSLRMVGAILSDKSADIKTKYTKIRDTAHDPEGKMFWRDPLTGAHTRTHPVVSAAMQDQLDRPDGESGSVKSEMDTFTQMYRDYPIISANTAVSDFSISDLMDGPVPATVYFVVNPDSLELCKPYVRLFLNLLINRNVGSISFKPDARQEKPHRWKLGMLLDEFTSTLGKLDVFARQLAFIAGYGIKPAIVIQDLQQLVEYYSETNNVLSNLHTLILGATNNPKTAQYMSELCGQETWRRMTGHGPTRNMQEQGRHILAADQATRLPIDEAILKLGGRYPSIVKKLKYYADDSDYAHKIRRTDFASDRVPMEYQSGRERLDRQVHEHREMQKAIFLEAQRIVIESAPRLNTADLPTAKPNVPAPEGDAAARAAVGDAFGDDMDDLMYGSVTEEPQKTTPAATKQKHGAPTATLHKPPTVQQSGEFTVERALAELRMLEKYQAGRQAPVLDEAE